MTTRAQLIAAAEEQGQHWVTLVDAHDAGPGELSRLELHIPSGVAVAVRRADAGEPPGYHSRCYFINRRTGEDLACGSRILYQEAFASPAELEAGLPGIRRDIESRFAGMVRIYEDNRRRAQRQAQRQAQRAEQAERATDGPR